MKQVTVEAEALERVPQPKPAPRLRPSRRAWALAIAGLVDLVQLAFLPLFGEGAASPAEDVLDVATAALLIGVLGFDWRLVAAFGVELVPGADLFPSWTAAVLALPSHKEVPAPAPSRS